MSYAIDSLMAISRPLNYETEIGTGETVRGFRNDCEIDVGCNGFDVVELGGVGVSRWLRKGAHLDRDVQVGERADRFDRVYIVSRFLSVMG